MPLLLWVKCGDDRININIIWFWIGISHGYDYLFILDMYTLLLLMIMEYVHICLLFTLDFWVNFYFLSFFLSTTWKWALCPVQINISFTYNVKPLGKAILFIHYLVWIQMVLNTKVVFIAKLKAILKIDKPYYNAVQLHIHSIVSIYITTYWKKDFIYQTNHTY